MDRLLKRIRRIRTAKLQSSEWSLFHDNASFHNAAIVKKFLANRNVAVLHHPPYSPDLAPADYFLFPKFKFPLKGRHFQTVEEIQFAVSRELNPLNPELNPICYLLALLGDHHFLHVSRIRVKLLTLRRLMSYIYGAPILDVSRSHTMTQHSR